MRQSNKNPGMLTSFLLAMTLVSGVAFANTEKGVSPNEILGGSLLLRGQSGYHVATRINTDVRISVSGLAIRTTLSQSFRNSSSQWVEGVYVFPLPDNAAVNRLRMTIGDRVIEGEIREKQAAKKAYEQAKQAGKKASLVEQQRANLFTTSIANIGPGQEVVIEIEYLDTVRYDEGTFSLRFPMTLTPRYIPGTPLADRKGSGWSADTHRVSDASLITPPMIVNSADHRITLQADVNVGLPLEFIASRYHPVKIVQEDARFTVRFAGEGIAMDHDFELLWRPTDAAVPSALMFSGK